jgi:hypothetical protein
MLCADGTRFSHQMHCTAPALVTPLSQSLLGARFYLRPAIAVVLIGQTSSFKLSPQSSPVPISQPYDLYIFHSHITLSRTLSYDKVESYRFQSHISARHHLSSICNPPPCFSQPCNEAVVLNLNQSSGISHDMSNSLPLSIIHYTDQVFTTVANHE